ncbi:hypothetical protein HMPREF9078_02385 [Capnocytophaga sp. oral taxon 380 str. F0488]|nr:hypothetical protein HMPREF9078_02385 [Capnocytophaga sp. oral taxon 380 str. F0488]
MHKSIYFSRNSKTLLLQLLKQKLLFYPFSTLLFQRKNLIQL